MMRIRKTLLTSLVLGMILIYGTIVFFKQNNSSYEEDFKLKSKKRGNDPNNKFWCSHINPYNIPAEDLEGKELPSAIIIGAKKCGTTELAQFLVTHPWIVTPLQEAHFFDNDQCYAKGLNACEYFCVQNKNFSNFNRQ